MKADDAVAGVGANRAQPGLDDLLGRGAEGPQGVIGQGAALMGVVALGRLFLTTILTKEVVETKLAQKLNHRRQAGLTGERRASLAIVDLGAFSPRRPATIVLFLLIRKGKFSG